MFERFLQVILLPQDKANHAIWAVWLFSVVVQFTDNINALLAVLIVAALKEAYDYLHRDKHTPDYFDFIASMYGGLLGYICTLGV